MTPDLSTLSSTKVFSPKTQSRFINFRDRLLEAVPSLLSDGHVTGISVDVPTGRISSNSDIDVFIVATSRRLKTLPPLSIDGIAVDLQWLDASQIQIDLQRKFLDLHALRRVSRLARSNVIWEKADALTKLLRLATSVALAPSDAGNLLLKAAIGLGAAIEDKTDAGAVLKARGAAYALATLAVALTPRGFEKPKWLLDTLRRSGNLELEIAILDLLGRPTLPPNPESVLEPTRLVILEMCRLCAWPELVRANNEEDDYVHIYRNYRDAESLILARMIPDALVAGDHALRLCDVLGEENLTGGDERVLLDIWRGNRDRIIEAQREETRIPISYTVNTLKGVGQDLQDRYKRQLHKIESIQA